MLKQSFDVLTQGWIPVIDTSGQQKLLGIRDVLLQAHELREVSDGSPLAEYAVYRFLSVFLMDALRPEDNIAIDELLEAGEFDAEALDEYISQCRAEGVSFDLFDEKRPFMQAPFRAEWDKVRKPASTLDYTIPNGNNHTHFDHRENQLISFSYGEAMRVLLAAQLFCTAGAQGYPSGVNGAPPYFGLIRGKNLFQTLVYSMISIDQPRDFDSMPVLWRNEMVIEPKKQVTNISWLYGMQFPTRRILLIPDEKTETVKEIYFSQGLNYTAVDNWTDPHVTYRRNKDGRFPWRPNHEKAIWRNLHDLIGKNKSLIVTQYVEKLEQHLLEKSQYIPLTIYGVQTNNANYLTSIRQDFDIPEEMLRNQDCAQHIERDIRWAEQTASALRKALTHEEVPPQNAAQAETEFYDACGTALLELCKQDLATAHPDFKECRRKWIEEVIDTEAKAALNRAMQRISLRGQAMMDVTHQQGILFAALRQIRKENQTDG